MPGMAAEAIVLAIQEQAAELDFSPPFQFGHPKAFQLATRIAALAPGESRPCVLHELRIGGRGHGA